MGAGSYAMYAYNGKISGTGKFLIGTESGNAGILARTGTVDLEMNDSSVFSGFTNIETTGKINIKMADNSIWKLSQSSNLSSINTASASQIVFTIDDLNDYTYITANEAVLNNSVMKVVLDGYNPVLNDAFILMVAGQLSGGNVIFDFSEALLDEGLAWDTSTFLTDGTIRVIGNLIPEASTFASIMGAFALGLVFMRRKSR
jgi:hypothetical protein